MTTLTQLSGEANNPAHQTLELAAIYARAGARVLPLKPKSKAASLNDWPNNATTDQNQITKWFGNGTAYNIGLAMGAWAHTATDNTYLVCIDIDRHNPEHDGVVAWQQLVAQHGNHGQPFIADTATGGMHLVYVSPVPLTNERGALPPGIDVRGQGGYIMTEPSTHPDNGRKPKWRAGASWPTAKPGLMPQWLLDIVQTKPEQIQRTATTKPRLHVLGGDPRPGDIYNNTHTWENELATHGWQLVETKNDMHGHKSFWARPGKHATKDAHSAVLAHDEGEHGVLTVFSTAAPSELMRNDHLTNTGGHYKFTSPFDFYTCMHHEGDYKKAAQMYGAEIRSEQQQQTDHLMGVAEQNPAPKPQLVAVSDEPPSGHTWVLQNMAEVMAQPYEPRVPDRLIMTDGCGLFYSNADNMVASGSGTMKTWLSVLTCLQQIQQGKHVVVIDYEMSARDWGYRFQKLGATPTELKLVHYCDPDEALHDTYMGAQRVTKAQQVMQEQILQVADMVGGLAWVVIDGITNAMTKNNLKILDNTDTAKFWELLPKQIWKMTGTGVGSNDHIAKGTNDNPTPIGAQHKIANTSGAAHILAATSYLSSHPKNPGVVVFNCIKDRHGQIGQHRKVAQAIFTPLDNGQLRAVIEPYTGEHETLQTNTDRKLLEQIQTLNDQGVQASLNKIHQLFGGSKGQLPERLKKLVSKNKVRNIGTDNNQNWQTVKQDIDTELF